MAKMNSTLILKIAIPLVGVAFAAYGFYVLTGLRLDAIETNITEVEEDAENTEAKVDSIEDNVSLIQYDIRYIKDELREQKEISKQILMELRK